MFSSHSSASWLTLVLPSMALCGEPGSYFWGSVSVKTSSSMAFHVCVSYHPWLKQIPGTFKNTYLPISCNRASQMALVVKNSHANAGDVRDMGSIPGLRRSPGEGNGNPLQYSCLENSMDRGVWQATVYGAAKSHTQLSIHKHRGFFFLIFPQILLCN